jgi:hypothetical protein
LSVTGLDAKALIEAMTEDERALLDSLIRQMEALKFKVRTRRPETRRDRSDVARAGARSTSVGCTAASADRRDSARV